MLTSTEVAAIAGLEDPVARNHAITAGYETLAVSLASYLGAGGTGNWCAFAVRASRTAGRTIRGEDLEALLRLRLARDPEVQRLVRVVSVAARAAGSSLDTESVRDAILRTLRLDAAVREVSAAVALGNRKVFEEVGGLVARFLATPDRPLTAAELGLRDGDPPEGDGYLLRAVERYRVLPTTSDPKARAELLLLANLEIAYDEQLRIQPEIDRAMNAGLPDPATFRRQLLERILPESAAPAMGFISRLFGWIGRKTTLEKEIDNVSEALRRRVRRAVTAEFMSIELPDGLEVSLGADLSARYPASLARIDHPELRALLARLDPDPDSLTGSGATDWSEWSERMHFVAELFRCYQEDPELLRMDAANGEERTNGEGRTATGERRPARTEWQGDPSPTPEA